MPPIRSAACPCAACRRGLDHRRTAATMGRHHPPRGMAAPRWWFKMNHNLRGDITRPEAWPHPLLAFHKPRRLPRNNPLALHVGEQARSVEFVRQINLPLADLRTFARVDRLRH
jgi:hypothetical protein